MHAPAGGAGLGRRRWLILLAFFLLMLLSGMGNTIYPAIGAFVAADLGLSATQIGMLGGASFFGSMLFNLFAGYVVDRHGVYIAGAITAAIVFFSLGVSFMAGTFAVLLVAATVLGIGLSFMNPLTQKGTFAWFRPRERGLAVGVKQGGIPAGTALNAAILPAICVAYGWHMSFVATAAIAAAILVFAVASYREPPQAATVGVSHAQPRLRDIFELMRHPEALIVGSVGIAHGALTISMLTFFVVILSQETDVSAVEVAFYLSVAQIVSVLGRPAIGSVSDLWRPEIRSRFLGVFVCVGAATAATLPLLLSLDLTPAAVLAIALGFGAVNSWSGLYFTVVTEVAGDARAGIGTSFGAFVNSLGTSGGPVLFGFLADVTGEWTLSILLMAALAAASGLAVLFGLRTAPPLTSENPT